MVRYRKPNKTERIMLASALLSNPKEGLEWMEEKMKKARSNKRFYKRDIKAMKNFIDTGYLFR